MPSFTNIIFYYQLKRHFVDSKVFYLDFLSGNELLFQDVSGGLSIFNFAQNKTQTFMLNTTFVSYFPYLAAHFKWRDS